MKEIKMKYEPEVKTMYYEIPPYEERNYFNITTEDLNSAILDDFHKAVSWLLRRGYEEYYEEYSNTINPAQQNAFIALRSYRIRKNGHYKSVKIFHLFLGGCVVTECNILNEWQK